MTPTAYAIACVAAMVIFALLTSNDRLRQQRDHWFIKADRLEQSLARAHALRETVLRIQLATQRKLRETEAALVEAGSEAATHANHLEALIDATSEKPLSLVKGGRHG